MDTWLGYDTCEEELELGCDHDFGDPTSTRFSTDAICECGGNLRNPAITDILQLLQTPILAVQLGDPFQESMFFTPH